MQHCGRDEYIAYMQRVMRNYTLPVCEHEQVLGVSRVRNGTFEVTTRETDRPDPQTTATGLWWCLQRCYFPQAFRRAW